MAEATWAEISAKLKDEMDARKRLIVPIAGYDVEFVIRKLTQHEEDRIRGQMRMTVGKDNRGEIPVALAESNIAVFRLGVVSGPQGFNPQNTAHIALLDSATRDEIVASIHGFSRLEEVTRLSFRGSGASGESDTDNGGTAV